jgi:hypothetical protein
MRRPRARGEAGHAAAAGGRSSTRPAWTSRLESLGAGPLQPVWDRIAKVDGRKALAEELARLTLLTNTLSSRHLEVTLDDKDPTRYVVQAGDP